MILDQRVQGSYILTLFSPVDMEVEVGSLGHLYLNNGWYLYVGSAMSGIKSRLNHHFKKNKSPHWHIDYLTNRLPIKNAVLFFDKRRLECFISEELKRGHDFIPGFGSSDCKCRSHLYFAGNELHIQHALKQLKSRYGINPVFLDHTKLQTFLDP